MEETTTRWDDKRTLCAISITFLLLVMVSLVAGASRMSHTGWQMAIFGDILRWREAMSMFLFAPLISVCFYLLVRAVGRGRVSLICGILTILSVYFIACGMGMHDPMNRFQSAYPALPTALRTSITYFDDELGHWIFWAGFVAGTWVLSFQQAFAPLDQSIRKRSVLFLLACSGVFFWVMFTNLRDEYPKTLLDLAIILLAALPATFLALVRFKRVAIRRQPILLVILPAYWGSVLATLWVWRSHF